MRAGPEEIPPPAARVIPVAERRLDALAILTCAVANTALAPIVFLLLLAPGTVTAGGDLLERGSWIAAHAAGWRAGWCLWVLVTTSLAWAFYALARHAQGVPQTRQLAVGIALSAATVDLVGIAISVAVVPELAGRLPGEGAAAAFGGAQTLAHALTDVTGFGLYTVAGLLLVPALFATSCYPRWLAWLGLALWSESVLGTVALAFGWPAANVLAGLAFVLLAPWTLASAWWVLRGQAGPGRGPGLGRGP